MIEIQARNTLSIHFVNDNDSVRNDIKTFTNFIKICRNEADKPGFKNLFDDDQRDLIRALSNQILPKKDEDVGIYADDRMINNRQQDL